jgi:predicted dehydrogenase
MAGAQEHTADETAGQTELNVDDSERVKLALVGCGMMGEAHAWGAANDPAGEIAIYVDRHLEKAQRLANKHGGIATVDYRQALEHPDIQGVVLALPLTLHHPFAMQALAADKHVLVEKPISLSLEQADEMIAAAEKGNLVLFVAHVLRFRPVLQFIQRAIAEGSLGTPVFARYHNEHWPPLRENAWMADWEEGGVFVGAAVHHSDLMRWWMGDVTAVTGHGLRVRPEFRQSGREDHAMIVYEFLSGAMGESTYSYASHHMRMHPAVEAAVTLTDGEILLFSDGTLHVYRHGEPAVLDELGTVTFRMRPSESRFEAGSAAEVPHFSSCIISGHQPAISAREARLALELVLLARQSAEEGRKFLVPSSQKL